MKVVRCTRMFKKHCPSGSAGAKVLPSSDKVGHEYLKNPISEIVEYGNRGQFPRIPQGTVTKLGRHSKPPAWLDL